MEASSSSQPGVYYTLGDEMPMRREKKYMGIFAATLNIMNTILGAGLFSISNSFTFCGLIPSTVMVTLSVIFTYISSVYIIKLSTALHSQSTVELVQMTTGRLGSILMRFSLLLFCIASMTAYLIMSTEIIQSFLLLAGVHTEAFKYRCVVVIVYSLVIPIAMTIPKKISVFSYISLLCILSIIMYTVAMIYKGCAQLPKQGVHCTVETGYFSLKIFNSLGVYCLAFAISGLLITITKSMENDNTKKFQATGMAYFFSYAITFITGVSGYLLFGEETKPLILSNFDKNDVLFIIVKVACFIVLTSSYPVVGLTVIGECSSIIYKMDKHEDLPWGKRSVCLFFQNIIPLIVAVFLPNVRPAMGIGGALGAGISCFILPPIMWFKTSPKKWYTPSQLFCIVFCLIGTCASAIATYESILDAIESFKN